MNEENIVENVYESAVKIFSVKNILRRDITTHIIHHLTLIGYVETVSGESKNLDISMLMHRRRTTTTTATKMYNSKGVSFICAVYLYLAFCIGVEAGNGNFLCYMFLYLWK